MLLSHSENKLWIKFQQHITPSISEYTVLLHFQFEFDRLLFIWSDLSNRIQTRLHWIYRNIQWNWSNQYTNSWNHFIVKMDNKKLTQNVKSKDSSVKLKQQNLFAAFAKSSCKYYLLSNELHNSCNSCTFTRSVLLMMQIKSNCYFIILYFLVGSENIDPNKSSDKLSENTASNFLQKEKINNECKIRNMLWFGIS